MKSLMKRSLALLVAFVLIISLVPSSVFTASAASYIYNKGVRGVLATELSSTANAWYEKYSTSYAELSALSGSSSTGSVPSSALYKELKTLMTNAHSTKTSYDGTKELYRYTDCQNGGGEISSFYSGTSIGPGWGEGGSWNREHTWPNSKGLGGQDENDIMMLRPTSTAENTSRGNTAYGKSSSYYHPNSESGGKYDLRGDCARICLYVYVRWGNTSYMWGQSGVMESKEVLLEWMEEDPVDTWELGRNDSVQSITGTRNVFVDYPELAFDLFEADIPAGYDTPSGSGAYTITAQSNNTSYGTVSVSGKTITASPKVGYQVSGYKVLSGSATVTQSGNVFTVSATGDCTIQILFAPRTQVSVTFIDRGVTQSTQSVYTGDSITLPACTTSALDDFTFCGWVTQQIAESESKPSIYGANSAYKVDSAATFYALYAKLGEGDSVEPVYTLVTDVSQLTEGASVVITASGTTALAMKQTGGTNNRYSGTITKNTDNTISFTDDVLIDLLTLGNGVNSGTYSFFSEANGQYLAAGTSSGSNILKLQNSLDAAASFTIAVNADGVATVVSQTSSDRNILRYNSSANIFSCYASGQKDISLYICSGGGVLYYTTSPVTCTHGNTSAVAATPATCTESGYTAGVFCKDCQTYISGHEVIDALGHSMDTGVVTTPATCTEAGIKTYTCGTCGIKETESIAALGHNTDAGAVTTPATCTEAGIKTYTCGTCGVTETESIPAIGHSFDTGVITTPASCTAEGVKTYTCAACGQKKTESIPMTDHTYVEDGQMMVCSSCGSIQEITTMKTGDQVIIFAPAYKKALSSTIVAAYYNAGVDITVSDDTIAGYADTEIWTVTVNDDGTYAFAQGGKNIGMAADYNSMSLGAVNDTWNVISLGGSLYNIQNVGRGTFMEWYDSKNNWSTYNSSDAATNDMFQLSFYVIGKGILGAEPSQPEVTEPTTSATQPSTPTEPVATEPSEPVTPKPTVTGNKYYIAAKRSDVFFYMTSNLGTASTKRYQAVDTDLSTLPELITEPQDGYVFTLVDNADGTYCITADGIEGDNYLGYSTKNSGVLVDEANALRLTKVDNDDGTVSFKYKASDADRFLSLNKTAGNNYFAWYQSGQISQLTLIPVVTEVELVAGMNIVLSDNIQVNMHLNVREDVIVNVGGEDISFAAEALSETEDGTYVAAVPVAAAQMTDTITVRLAGENIDPDAPVYSVRSYADAILADSNHSQYHALVKEMLNYGGKAQVYFDHNTDDPANAGITGVEAENVPESTTELSVTGTVEGISFYAASLVYRDKVALRFYFKTTAETVAGCTFTVNGTSCKPVQKGDYYYIEVSGITPDKLDQQVTVVVSGADEAALTVNYSPMNYIVRMSQKGNDALKDLLKALYNYHLVAKLLCGENSATYKALNSGVWYMFYTTRTNGDGADVIDLIVIDFSLGVLDICYDPAHVPADSAQQWIDGFGSLEKINGEYYFSGSGTGPCDFDYSIKDNVISLFTNEFSTSIEMRFERTADNCLTLISDCKFDTFVGSVGDVFYWSELDWLVDSI